MTGQDRYLIPALRVQMRQKENNDSCGQEEGELGHLCHHSTNQPHGSQKCLPNDEHLEKGRFRVELEWDLARKGGVHSTAGASGAASQRPLLLHWSPIS